MLTCAIVHLLLGRYGVIHATNEFILRYEWEIVYMTLHRRNEPDIAIRRPITGSG